MATRKQQANTAGKSYSSGRVGVEELVTELRHKYVTILKSLYWEFFEEG
mgnify:CR=1 FL=1